MKMSARLLALTITALFIGSTMTALVSPIELEPQQNTLDDEPVVSRAASSPGHSVFAEYYGADWCPPCQNGGSPSMHALKTSFPDDYVYISYFEANGQGVSDPLNRLSHMRDGTGSIPAAVFGDARAGSSYHKLGAATGTTSYDNEFTNGGDMKSVNDFKLSITQSQNGANMDITYKLEYLGSSPSQTVYLLAVVVEETGPDTYNDGSTQPHNVIRSWLLNSANNNFESFTLTPNTPVTKTWTEPVSSVRANGATSAADNFVSVGAIMNGDKATWNDVYAASDSTMGPKIDIGISNFAINNPSSSAGYVRGDTLTLEATVKNVGDLDYSDGGTVEFYYEENNNIISVDTSSVGTLPFTGSNSMTVSTTVDTTNFPESDYLKTFGVRITGLVGDSSSMNNQATMIFNHDRPPITKNPQIVGDQTVERGNPAIVLAKSDVSNSNDFVDDAASTTFNVEVSPTGLNQWISSVVTGGQSIVNSETPNEGREYVITPTTAMSSGWYDVRTQAIDSRGQTGSWMSITGTSGFELQNGVPQVISDPIPSVMCNTPTMVSMDGHIDDPETSLENLIVTSSSESFVAWHASTKELEVNFQGTELDTCPTGQQGIEVQVDDGGDYSATGELPYGTLLFNVIENGQPRWVGLPTQSVVEGGSGLLALLPYLKDTDDSGQPADASTLTLELISNSNEEAIMATLNGKIIGFETMDEDVNGQAILTIRASDGVKTSDTTLTVNIQPVNDAPRITPFDDLETITLKRNTQFVVDLGSRVIDVDNPASEAFISVSSSEPGAARFSFIDGSLTLQFEETGMQTVTISVIDKYDSNIYVMNVEVFDAYPFLLSLSDDGSGYMFVGLEDLYIGQTPTVTMKLTSAAPTFTYISVTWNICSKLTGTCDGLLQENLDVSQSASNWNKKLVIPSVLNSGFAREDGSQFKDYYELSIVASDGTSEYKTMSSTKWNITEELPAIEDMPDTMFTNYLEDLTAEKVEIMAKIESAVVGEDTTSLEVKLTAVEGELETACEDSRANCITDSQSGTTSIEDSSGLNIQMIGIIAGVVLLGLLLTLMITRRNRGSEKPDAWNDTAWNPNMVPAGDSVANSMYGGAQEIFQQPVAIVAAPPLAAGPPLPAGGLPAGWTAEQWAYYGQQFLDGTL
ncbi:MAG: hypothetical protein QMC49_02185 [Candidatus Poseidoniaceae archaeon]